MGTGSVTRASEKKKKKRKLKRSWRPLLDGAPVLAIFPPVASEQGQVLSQTFGASQGPARRNWMRWAREARSDIDSWKK